MDLFAVVDQVIELLRSRSRVSYRALQVQFNLDDEALDALKAELIDELIRAVAPLDEATVQRGLAQLVDAELLYQRGRPPQAQYRFKHALIQEAAYQSLLKSTRQQAHQRSAQVLAEGFPVVVETQPELQAHHYTEAGLIEQGIPYWQRSGQRAVAHSAYVEAIRHCRRGLELLQTLPNTSTRL
jgi:predicted ATPase